MEQKESNDLNQYAVKEKQESLEKFTIAPWSPITGSQTVDKKTRETIKNIGTIHKSNITPLKQNKRKSYTHHIPA